MNKAIKVKNTVVPINLNVKPGFTGLVVVKLVNGEEKAQFPLKPNEFFGSLESFLNDARLAGYQVIPPTA